jgi:hypothetical protein
MLLVGNMLNFPLRIPYSHSQRPPIPSQVLRYGVGTYARLGIVVPPSFPQMPSPDGERCPQGDALCQRVAIVDRLRDHLLRETIHLLEARGVSLTTMQIDDAHVSLERNEVDMVMRFFSFEIATMWPASTGRLSSDQSVMHIRVLLGWTASHTYENYFGCGDRPEDMWADRDAFWSQMDWCTSHIARQIVDALL